MGYRRKARECALQMLFQVDMTGEDERKVRDRYWQENPAPAAVKDYADRIVAGTGAERDAIDRRIQAVTANWRIERMALVDRNLLRLAVYEFLHEPQTPKKVVINEAIEIAKKFSSEDAVQFVNGVLDAVLREIAPVVAPHGD
jgi:N utilization substance protein B